MKFNKHLSQLEAVHQIASPIGVTVDALQISDYIHHMLENGEKYGLKDVDSDWFTFYAKKHGDLASKLVMDKLCESGHIVNMKCLNEGIQNFLFEGLTEENRIKYYPDVPVETFNKYISADPTNGTYQKWILNLRKKGLKEEDLYKVNEYLKIFDKYKVKLSVKDINQIKSINELYTVIEPIKQKLDSGDKSVESSNEQARIAKGDVTKLYEDSQWLILSPKTQESACYYGKGTQWCTAAETSDNMFDNYNKKGQLYIIIDKAHKDQGGKWQFHKETESFMDSTDNPVKNIDTIFPMPVLEKICELYGIGNMLTVIDDVELCKKLIEKYSDPESFKDISSVLDRLIHNRKSQIVMYIYENYYEMLNEGDISSILNYVSYPVIKPELDKVLDKIYEHGTLKTFPRNGLIKLAVSIIRDKDDDDTLYNKLTSDVSGDVINDKSITRLKKLLESIKNTRDPLTYKSVCVEIINACLDYGIYDDRVIPYLLSLHKYDQSDYMTLLNTCMAGILVKGIDYLINDPNFSIPRKIYNIMNEVYNTGGRKQLIDKLNAMNPDKITDET